MASEDLERLDELVEVVDLDRGVATKHRRERAIRADEGACVGERRPRRRLRAPDLEADDGLVGLRTLAQRVDEFVRPSHGFEKEPDHARPRILGEEREVVGGVCHRFRTGRDDTAQPDTPSERKKCVGDRS